jgi:hypothetical protein
MAPFLRDRYLYDRARLVSTLARSASEGLARARPSLALRAKVLPHHAR